MDFKNKVVLVTGGSSGIGRATGILFAARGARLALAGRDASTLRAAGAACAARAMPGAPPPLLLAVDLATDEGCERAARDTLQHYGRLDILINNAGITCRTTLETTDMETFDSVFNTNVRGVFNLTRLLAPALIEAKGNIVNISSISGTRVHVGSLPYSMSKAALDHFSRLIAVELGPKGVRVNTVSPGVTVTEVLKRATGCSEEQYASWVRSMERSIPLGRAASPEEVARAVLYLASEESALVTGTLLKVDGGLDLHTPAMTPAPHSGKS